MKFTDISPTLAAEIAFLEQHSLLFSGRGDGRFDPDAGVTREEMVYFLTRVVRADLAIRSTQLVAAIAKMLPPVCAVRAMLADGTGSGTGFFVTPQGRFLTNAHVVEGAKSLRCETVGSVFNATVVRVDKPNDLALCQVNSIGPFPTVEWGDSDSLKEGQEVLTIGNAFGLGIRVALGILGAPERYVQYQVGDQLVVLPALDHTAPQSPGNSGGPLFNSAGQVVGVSNAGIPAGSNIAFAIRGNLARAFVEGVPA